LVAAKGRAGLPILEHDSESDKVSSPLFGAAMSDGFLGYKASLMLDVVVCALAVVVPTLLASLYAVKMRRNYRLHKALQISLGLLLLAAVGLFEIDMRLHGGIDGILAKRSRPLMPGERSSFDSLLYVHLFFAVSTVVLWATTLILALKRIPNPPVPCNHSRLHKRLGWLSAADITLTSVTGLMVYYYGFVVA
jgi:putative membrane protein